MHVLDDERPRRPDVQLRRQLLDQASQPARRRLALAQPALKADDSDRLEEGDRDAEVVRFARPEGDELELRLVRDVVLDGSGIERAQADRDMTISQWTVSVTFTEAGSQRLFEVTRDNVDRRLAMVVDGQIVTAPTIRSPIRGGAEINGAFDRERAEELAKAINDAARGAGTQPSR